MRCCCSVFGCGHGSGTGICGWDLCVDGGLDGLGVEGWDVGIYDSILECADKDA